MALSFHDKFQRTIAVITFILIAIRLYIRCWVRWRFPSLSDFFVMAAWVMYFIPVIVDEAIVPHMDIKNNPDDRIWYLKWVYYWFIQYFTIYYAIKASLLLFYNEWIPRSLNCIWIANRILMVVVGICYGYTAGILIFRCHPISGNWDIHGKGCQASRKRWVFISTSVLHLFTDLLIYALPVFVLYYMSAVSRAKKLGAGFMFMLGIISITFSALRFGLSMWNSFHPKNRVNDGVIFISQNLDESAGIFVVCCPAIKLFAIRCYRYWKRVYYKMRGKPMMDEVELSSMKNSGGRAEKGEAGSLSSNVGITTYVDSPGRADGRGFDDLYSIKSPVVQELVPDTPSDGISSNTNLNGPAPAPPAPSEQELMERIQAFHFGR